MIADDPSIHFHAPGTSLRELLLGLGLICVTAISAQGQLTIANEGGTNVMIRWPSSMQPLLERSFSLTSPVWESVTNRTEVVDGQYQVSIPIASDGTRFFRPAPLITAHCGIIGGNPIWFTYSAAASGVLTLSTAGSNFDTVLAVYTQDLFLVVCDNNSGPDGKTSVAQFVVTAESLYFIVVDGVNGATGVVSLSYDLRPVP